MQNKEENIEKNTGTRVSLPQNSHKGKMFACNVALSLNFVMEILLCAMGKSAWFIFNDDKDNKSSLISLHFTTVEIARSCVPSPRYLAHKEGLSSALCIRLAGLGTVRNFIHLFRLLSHYGAVDARPNGANSFEKLLGTLFFPTISVSLCNCLPGFLFFPQIHTRM